jgi:hypothetical protein
VAPIGWLIIGWISAQEGRATQEIDNETLEL